MSGSLFWDTVYYNTAAAATRITHHHALRHTSIKSVCRLALPMDIFRLPDTGLIRGHIISAVTSLRKCFKRRSRRGMVGSGWDMQPRLQDVSFDIHWRPFIRKNCSMFNYEWKPTVAWKLADSRVLVRSISLPTRWSMRTYLSCICLPPHRLSFHRLGYCKHLTILFKLILLKLTVHFCCLINDSLSLTSLQKDSNMKYFEWINGQMCGHENAIN